LVVPEAIRSVAAERSGLPPGRLLGLDAGQTTVASDFRFTAVPAAHEQLDKDSAGRHLYLGYVVQFGPWTVYHSGDTVRYEGMVEWLAPKQVQVALLPINGRNPARRVAGNLDGPEAAALATEIGARIVIPCHYEMFEFNTASPEPFVRTARELGQGFRVLRAGESWSSECSATV
jgi:L-ascorbate metabolism protein UlaG (beta-lactamase superfamily)